MKINIFIVIGALLLCVGFSLVFRCCNSTLNSKDISQFSRLGVRDPIITGWDFWACGEGYSGSKFTATDISGHSVTGTVCLSPWFHTSLYLEP